LKPIERVLVCGRRSGDRVKVTATTRALESPALESPYKYLWAGIGIETYVIRKIAVRTERGIKFAYVLLDSEVSAKIDNGSKHASAVATKEALKVLRESDWTEVVAQ
jgi:hypothetical protein